MFRCVACRRRSERRRDQCRCGAWHTMVTVETSGQGPGPISAADALGATVDRVTTGLAPWDAVLSGGPAIGSTMLLYGVPGAGKSSEALRLAGAVATATSSRALVLSSEMPAELLASYCARLEVPLDRVDLWHVHAWRVARRAIGPAYRAIVVDSIQPFGDVARVLRDLEDAASAVRIVVARVNTRGEPSGARDLPHDVDAVGRVTKQHIEIVKNRFGVAPLRRARLALAKR